MSAARPRPPVTSDAHAYTGGEAELDSKCMMALYLQIEDGRKRRGEICIHKKRETERESREASLREIDMLCELGGTCGLMTLSA